MIKLNLALWIVSLTLQIILLATLLMRRITARFPIFTILIGFYVLRSATLHTLSSYLGGRLYELIFSGLAVIDVALQVAVAWELLSAARSAPVPLNSIGIARGRFLRRLGKFALFLVAAAALAIVISTQIHANPRAPMGRVVLFTSMLFLMVFFASLPKETPALVRRIAGGFALYAGASILCQVERTVAAAERDVTAFNRWSYAEATAYLVAVLFWIFALSGVSRSIAIRSRGARSSLI